MSSVGFHSAGEKISGGDFADSLNYQPFENTRENIQLIETCVDEISGKFPNVEVDYRITRTNERDAATQQQCAITIEGEEKEGDTSSNDGKRQESDAQAEAYTSRHRQEQASDRHQIHSYADIHHTINYSLDEDSQKLVFDSMERGGVTPTDGLDHALENNDVHCSCGKTNLSKQEAIKHLNDIQSADNSALSDSNDSTQQQKSTEATDPSGACPECLGEVTYDDSASELVCSDCGFVITDCPECGSNDIVYDDSASESVCSDCGIVIGSSTDITDDPDALEWDTFDDMTQSGEPKESISKKMEKARDSADTDSRHDDSTTETADEWKMWHPCLECQSTALAQITEQHLSVSATEDGSYGGETGSIQEYNYVECTDCGEVLLDEIGRK